MVDIRDIKILEILQKNGRSTASEIAKVVDLSIPAVGERIKKLADKGLIERFVAILNHKNAGLDLTAYVFIVSEHSDHYDEFVNKANENMEVMECHSITGTGSHLLKIRVKNSQALEDFLYEIQNWPGVSRTQSNVVLSTYKESTDIDLKTLKEIHNIT
ncbi:MAG: Lrp/AsnC family transcriptional regulator [Candidatus Marinimicrobia bacterium]|jgi:Lrp/AsnC family leucine-responsive transcriptional regulator|nr:Lrp/AsnC family transcriptional regulator [Candidatus Neomarinimicrobiota bacterium]MBT3948357.1 Lrp/AsnC family transcriptional regulator [Candidatus Neomarinimicrobiota bacterium]MBT4065530.1 Lrp/AsnC family transcriptional regulator [Candidatus Neomarinimicrobiota bacterium]MBT4307458.1 Lrp/AsnC family transcriptional regulator [Candidatus Neomarinimicrobiota bacterium]MBT4452526.1 Lrp/AsnC family transcriptional regulator [Candidatus Neomarinimicrobiota bacterium]|tara:strand:+ start:477 stop:953 length:477 start_codon:yes stop_codon:yes gene_type:complete